MGSRRPQQELVGRAQRNAQRLLKLVNTLLDFAKVEGGRGDARFEPTTDLAASTAELKSSFRSICEHAGLALVVDCPPLPERVFVDRDQWEKIVLNLLSNAFKFALEGRIEVRLQASADGTHAELTVADTGARAAQPAGTHPQRAALLKRGGAAGEVERLHEMLERQVGNMVRLVDDLMEASRISRGQLELKLLPLDLADVLRTAVETSKPLIDANQHSLNVVLPGAPLPMDGDAVRLAQLFANLLNNAAHYTDIGGHIELKATNAGDRVEVVVRDDGIGIDAAQLPRMFEMFMQLDRSQPRGHGGLGIGLALVLRLAQMHGGSVQAASDGSGRGSTLTVRLPLTQRPVVSPLCRRQRPRSTRGAS